MTTTLKLTGRQEIAEGTMAFHFEKPARLDIRGRPGNRYHSARAIGNGRRRKYANVHDSERAARERTHGGDPHARHRIQASVEGDAGRHRCSDGEPGPAT